MEGIATTTNIPITVQQLEAIVCIAEALSETKLQPFATKVDMEEALRLFQVSMQDCLLWHCQGWRALVARRTRRC